MLSILVALAVALRGSEDAYARATRGGEGALISNKLSGAHVHRHDLAHLLKSRMLDMHRQQRALPVLDHIPSFPPPSPFYRNRPDLARP